MVGEGRVESSEGISMVTAADEGEEPMQTDSQSKDVMSSAASVLQVHVESGVSTGNTLKRTHTLTAPDPSPSLRWFPRCPTVFLRS